MTAFNFDEGVAHSALARVHADLAVHRESIAFRAARDWLDALAARQQAAMTSCPREKLADAQVRLKQILAIRAAMHESQQGGTGFVCD